MAKTNVGEIKKTPCILGGPESIAPLFQMLISRVQIIIFEQIFFCFAAH